MDKARDFEYVRRLPSTNLQELGYKEQVFDRQVLLNEEWEPYALRSGKGHAVAAEEHVKWITETWDEHAVRKVDQECYLSEKEREHAEELRLEEFLKKKRREKSDSTIAFLMKRQHNLHADRTQSRHFLFVDFAELQQLKFARERSIIEAAEEMLRVKIEECAKDSSFILGNALAWSHELHLMYQLRRERNEEEERLRIEEERLRAIEEERLREEQRKRDEEEAERRRREQADIDKRLERKRREEERRAKARAERERMKERDVEKETEKDPEPEGEEIKPSSPVADSTCEVSEAAVEEAEPEIPQIAVAEEAKLHTIIFSPLDGDSIVALFKSVTTILSSGGDNSYVMSIRQKPSESSVICQNGIFFCEPFAAGENTHLLGKSIRTDTCVTVSSEHLHAALPDSVEVYTHDNTEVISDVRLDDRCEMFIPGEKAEETLALFPVRLPSYEYSPYIVAISREKANSLSPDEIELAGQLVYSLCEKITAHVRNEYVSQLCQQCVEWINACTGCENVYVSLRSSSQNTLTYVAATPSHRFLIGKSHSLSDESESGISFAAMSMSLQEGKVFSVNYADVSKTENSELPEKNLRFFAEGGEKKGSLVASTITGAKNGIPTSVGMVFTDHIGTKKKFSPVDKEIITSSTQLLADIILGNEDGSLDQHLMIEDAVSGLSPITFLKALWKRARERLREITPNQLLELSKYLHPPPTIPLVVQATLFITLGCKPKKIEKWEDARKRVTKKLLDKMLVFDPTNLKARKKPFFVHSKKLLKGLTAVDVFERGSIPAQSFFVWVFTAILLRKHSVEIKKHAENGEWKNADGGSILSLGTDDTVATDEMNEGDDFDDTAEDGDDEDEDELDVEDD